MLILACDTSGRACSAALWEDGRILQEDFLNEGLTHSETFMPMVHNLIAKSGRTYSELTALACAVGPGSFTGIRIGVAAVKTMASILHKPAVGVSSLSCLARPFAESGRPVAPMIDARSRRIFCSAYLDGVERIPEAVRPVQEFGDLLAVTFPEREILFCGNAADQYADDPAWDRVARFPSDPNIDGREIRSSFVAILAAEALAQSVTDVTLNKSSRYFEAFPPQSLVPSYRALTSAERNFPDGRPNL